MNIRQLRHGKHVEPYFHYFRALIMILIILKAFTYSVNSVFGVS